MLELLSHPVIAIGILLGALIFVHELGHYLVGRLCKIGVETFSIGFGPKLFSFKHKNTLYQLALVPLGGYVKFAGMREREDVPEPFKGHEFFRASYSAKVATLFAGPFFNFLLAVFVYIGLGMFGIEHTPSILGTIRSESPADKAGLLPQDKVLQINDKEIRTWMDMQELITGSAGKTLTFTVQRDQVNLKLPVTPHAEQAEDIFGKIKEVGRIGVGPSTLKPLVSVYQNSLAANKGIATGDLLTKVEFKTKEGSKTYDAIESFDQFSRILSSSDLKETQTISLSLQKQDGAVYTAELPLDNNSLETTNYRKQSEIILAAWGITSSALTVKQDPHNQLLFGDILLAAEDIELIDIYSLQKILETNKKAFLLIKIQRAEQALSMVYHLKAVEVQKPQGKELLYTLPVQFLGDYTNPAPYIERYEFFAAWAYGVKTAVGQTKELFQALIGLFTGDVPLKSLGGPILVAKAAGDSIKFGFQAFFKTMALVSINLFIVNLFPIPILDGGQIVVNTIERLRRRPLGEVAIENYQKIGFIIVMSLVVLATYNDISRFWTTMVQDILGQ